jgi:hypothetical protein
MPVGRRVNLNNLQATAIQRGHGKGGETMTKFLSSLMCAASAAISLGGPSLVQAQAFPSKPITWIVPFPPGGVTDPVSRMVAKSRGVGQAVIIDRRAPRASLRLNW